MLYIIVDLKCCVNSWCTANWLSSIYIYLLLFQILFSSTLSQNIKQGSLCYTAGPFWLSILHIVPCIYVHSKLLIYPPHPTLNFLFLIPSTGWWILASHQVVVQLYPQSSVQIRISPTFTSRAMLLETWGSSYSVRGSCTTTASFRCWSKSLSLLQWWDCIVAPGNGVVWENDEKW